jgi:hypothetical protein
MLPALGVKGLGAPRGAECYSWAAGAAGENAADLGDGDAGDFAGHASCGWGCKDEFVVFSAVEGLVEGRVWVDGEQSGVDFSSYAGLFAEVGEICGEAVAEVDGSGGQAVVGQPEALSDAGMGVEVQGELRI